MKILILILFSLSVVGRCQAQSEVRFIEDTSDVKIKTSVHRSYLPTPSMATKLAIIPGVGQIYNRDYWKLPIVYAAILGGGYTVYLNNLKYHDYLKAYESFYDLEKASSGYGQLLPGLTTDSSRVVLVRNLLATKSSEYKLTYNAISKGKDYWRRNRNLAVIATGLIYSLSIIEANVAAHLKSFDISDDLSLKVAPKISQPQVFKPTLGIQLVFNFK